MCARDDPLFHIRTNSWHVRPDVAATAAATIVVLPLITAKRRGHIDQSWCRDFPLCLLPVAMFNVHCSFLCFIFFLSCRWTLPTKISTHHYVRCTPATWMQNIFIDNNNNNNNGSTLPLTAQLILIRKQVVYDVVYYWRDDDDDWYSPKLNMYTF